MPYEIPEVFNKALEVAIALDVTYQEGPDVYTERKVLEYIVSRLTLQEQREFLEARHQRNLEALEASHRGDL
jgi:hypothetical protein